jgi:hypothetical protein
MVIGVVVVAVFALLIGLRVYGLVGRDGAVHYAVPGALRLSAYRKRLERKLGIHN